jgi:hypothetical protein
MKNKVKEFYKTLYTMPAAEHDLERFGRELIEEFVQELKKNQIAVKWNYGFDSVIFVDKLNKIKEDFCGDGHDKGDSNESHGAGAAGDCKEDQSL